MAINLVVENVNLVIEIPLEQQTCDTVNIYVDGEVKYWKTLLEKHVKPENFEEYVTKSPKHTVLRRLRRNVKTGQLNIDTVLDELRKSYDRSVPESMNYISHFQNVKSLQELIPHFGNVTAGFREIENFYLKNGYLFGKWLNAASKLYRYERFVKKNNGLPSTFEKWLKPYGISKSKSETYRRLAKLVESAKKIVNCNVSVKYIMKHYIELLTYFQNEPTGVWSHDIDCTCDECTNYFSIDN